MLKSILLRVTLMALAVSFMLVGVVTALFPRPIVDLLNLEQVNVILLGMWGAMLVLLGVGAFLANRDPIRHILWLRLTIGFLFGIAVYAGLVYSGGGISRDTAILLAVIGIVPGALLLILFPRSPRLVSTRVRSPDGVLFTDADDGGLFVRRRSGTFNPYVIRLPREPAMPDMHHRLHPNPATNPSRVMVVGGGAREHAITVKLRESAGLEELFVAPGNGGTASIAENLPISATDTEAIVQAARERNVELVIIGPEAPLALGLGNAVRDAGILCLGPTQEAARIEWSKSFAKQVMDDAGVPTAAWTHFDDYSQAAEYIRAHPAPHVIKADGLAAGKGVAVCETEQDAVTFLHHVMRLRDFGESGDSVVIEEALSGVELSVFAFCDGEQMVLVPPACDYKRVFDNDEGSNTGGMGSYSPPEFVTDKLMADIRDTIIRPVLRRMVELGVPYSGILYAGLILTDDGPKVIEFNSRMGDPEAQVVLPRITSDFLQLAAATAAGKLEEVYLEWTPQPAVGIAIASEGYPGDYPTGLEITGLNTLDYDAIAFHAGTRLAPSPSVRPEPVEGQLSQKLVTAGGRVLTVTALGDTMEQARDKAYTNAARVQFQGAHYRKDIALRAVTPAHPKPVEGPSP